MRFRISDTIQRALVTAGLYPRANPIKRVIHGGKESGEFLDRSFVNHAGSRTYKLYVPASYVLEAHESFPLVVMLHGCKQSPDDFAAGTRMNALAEEHGFLVVYPAQAPRANGSSCWNWFRAEDQARDSGEPSIIAGITREVASSYRVDPRRIFVAGMSAGGAMAAILATTYPDLYAAVGIHSGLPYGAAHDVPSAFAAMQAGTAPRNLHTTSRVPTIVFHGDNDHTVNARNGNAIVQQAVAAESDGARLRIDANAQAAASGRSYSRTDYLDNADQRIIEHWTVHGAGHAWSGGSPAGSFTDARGPDASSEMIRFFYSQGGPRS